ncbi:MAG TPA: hypothetical protein VGQ09_09715 [Chitinophagaceae bacterium]|jgi:hypothetical protein|nr:hypothetical protein [Chitinophagaceae bacterium]
MKRTFYFVLLVTVFITTFNSCKKEKDASFSKEQITGMWEGILQANPNTSDVRFNLKTSGIVEVDILPFDGVTDLKGTWDVSGTSFTSQFVDNGTLKLKGQVSGDGRNINGTLELSIGGETTSGNFALSKK